MLLMEDQVPANSFPQEPQQDFTPPPLPNFEEMRRRALQDAIEQVTQRSTVPAASMQPPQQPQYQPSKAQVPNDFHPAELSKPQNKVPEPNLVYLRRNLTMAELGVILLIAVGIVAGVQGAWHFASDIIPRIEIREK
jgi:hypothetical protein